MSDLSYSPQWYRNHGYLFDGMFKSLDDFLRSREGRYLEAWDANDMLTLLDTWQRGDVSSVRDGGDFVSCLGAVKAKALLMPCKTDLYLCARHRPRSGFFCNISGTDCWAFGDSSRFRLHTVQ